TLAELGARQTAIAVERGRGDRPEHGSHQQARDRAGVDRKFRTTGKGRGEVRPRTRSCVDHEVALADATALEQVEQRGRTVIDVDEAAHAAASAQRDEPLARTRGTVKVLREP